MEINFDKKQPSNYSKDTINLDFDKPAKKIYFVPLTEENKNITYEDCENVRCLSDGQM